MKSIFSLLGLGGALLLFTGCTATNVTTVATPLGPALLQTSDGGTLLHVGGKDIPLKDYRGVDIVGFMSANGNPVMLLTGKTVVCNKRYAVLTVTSFDADLTQIGNCGEGYVFGGDGSNAFVSQVNSDDPKIWAFENGKFNGPVLRSQMYPKEEKPVVRRWRKHR